MIVSGTYRENNTIWEEYGVTQILRLLIRYPHLDFIDIGANIGTYTMYAAALGRFVLAIDCFAPNLARIQQAIQLTNVGNRVVLVQNAIYIRSGEFLPLSVVKDNIGAQAIEAPNNQKNTVHVPNNRSTSDPYVVKTITFDELLPIFIARGVRGALMKIDIEGSESFVVQKGGRVFEKLDIPFVQMEWHIVRQHADRVKVILDFFIKLNYDPMTCACGKLDPAKYSSWPSDICWIKQNFSNFC
jgi:FkbM family methyltransferase